jgi:hypothetical protein
MIKLKLVPRTSETIEVQDMEGHPRTFLHIDDFYVSYAPGVDNIVYDKLSVGRSVVVSVDLFEVCDE